VGWVVTGRTPILGDAKELSGFGFNRHQSRVRLRSSLGWVVTGRTSILSHAEQQGGNKLQQEGHQSIIDHAELLMSRRTLQLVKCMERST
jgi:hypothetical protein